jgi:hypothetical protein
MTSAYPFPLVSPQYYNYVGFFAIALLAGGATNTGMRRIYIVGYSPLHAVRVA